MKLKGLMKNISDRVAIRLYEDGVIYFSGNCGENRGYLKENYGGYEVAGIEPGLYVDHEEWEIKAYVDVETIGHTDEA